eukprot:5960160-Lingulodinium_polyedra.AAC.1
MGRGRGRPFKVPCIKHCPVQQTRATALRVNQRPSVVIGRLVPFARAALPEDGIRRARPQQNSPEVEF